MLKLQVVAGIFNLRKLEKVVSFKLSSKRQILTLLRHLLKIKMLENCVFNPPSQNSLVISQKINKMHIRETEVKCFACRSSGYLREIKNKVFVVPKTCQDEFINYRYQDWI